LVVASRGRGRGPILVGNGNGNGNGNGRRRGKEAGYTLVMLVIMIAILSISMGVAVQTASFQMRREREAELIFRGEQFVEAIRLFKAKYGRYPMRLKEIYEANPRVIRKKWKDPITDSDNWGLIFLGQEGNRLGQQGRGVLGPAVPGAGDETGARPISTQTPFGQPQPSLGEKGDGSDSVRGGTGDDPTGLGAVDADRMVGPIIGVHSTSCDESIKVYEGHTTYCEWKFIYREQPQVGGTQRGRRGPPTNRGLHPSDWIKEPGEGEPGSGGPGGPGAPPPIRTPPRP
jgi:type II secretory pathway pseudopilin PulG